MSRRYLLLRALLWGLPTVGASLTGVPVQAQVRWNLEARGGAGIPSGTLADIQDPGPALGLGVGLWVKPRLGVRFDGDWQLLGGGSPAGPKLPDMTLGHYGLGLEVHLLQPGLIPWTALIGAGVGVTSVSLTRRDPVRGVVELDETYFSTHGEVSLGYDVLVGLNLFLKAQVQVVFGDEGDLIFIPEGDPGDGSSALPRVGTTVSVPLTAGIRFDFLRR